MTRRAMSLILLCGGVALLGFACATKSFVQEQVSATENKLTQQMTATETVQDTRLRETANRVGETRQAIDVADQRLNGLDLRVGEASARAGSAETRARDVEARLSQRFAGRNKYRLMETKSVYFDSGQTEVRSQDVDELAAVAKALTADSNAILELQGFTDARGSDRYNRELARERVEAVMRHLVQHHGVELRQLRAISMGKVALVAGEKASPDVLARARRVDIRLLAPWSSWEDTLGQTDPAAREHTANAVPEPREPATISALPARTEPMPLPPPGEIDAPPGEGLRQFLKTITPEDLGG